MIDKASDYDFANVEGIENIDGSILPVRDVSDNGSAYILKLEDVAFLLESALERNAVFTGSSAKSTAKFRLPILKDSLAPGDGTTYIGLSYVFQQLFLYLFNWYYLDGTGTAIRNYGFVKKDYAFDAVFAGSSKANTIAGNLDCWAGIAWPDAYYMADTRKSADEEFGTDLAVPFKLGTGRYRVLYDDHRYLSLDFLRRWYYDIREKTNRPISECADACLSLDGNYHVHSEYTDGSGSLKTTDRDYPYTPASSDRWVDVYTRYVGDKTTPGGNAEITYYLNGTTGIFVNAKMADERISANRKVLILAELFATDESGGTEKKKYCALSYDATKNESYVADESKSRYANWSLESLAFGKSECEDLCRLNTGSFSYGLRIYDVLICGDATWKSEVESTGWEWEPES